MIQKGYRFDVNNHNWILLNNHFINLAFSYMTFVIKHRLEIICPVHKLVHSEQVNLKNLRFDVEPYNFIFNRKSFFLDCHMKDIG